jgi:hypothetical protein
MNLKTAATGATFAHGVDTGPGGLSKRYHVGCAACRSDLPREPETWADFTERFII